MPMKLMLKILFNGVNLNPTTAVNLEDLHTEVSRLMNLNLPKGKLKHLQRIGRFSIFLFLFENKTRCSAATETDFANVDFPHAQMSLPALAVNRNVAWSFFTLNETLNDDLGKYFEQSNGKTLKDCFCFPKPDYEDQRMTCLLPTIRCHYDLYGSMALARVGKIEAANQRDG